MFCQATGFGGTVQEGRSVEDKLRAREANRWGAPPPVSMAGKGPAPKWAMACARVRCFQGVASGAPHSGAKQEGQRVLPSERLVLHLSSRTP